MRDAMRNAVAVTILLSVYLQCPAVSPSADIVQGCHVFTERTRPLRGLSPWEGQGRGKLRRREVF